MTYSFGIYYLVWLDITAAAAAAATSTSTIDRLLLRRQLLNGRPVERQVEIVGGGLVVAGGGITGQGGGRSGHLDGIRASVPDVSIANVNETEVVKSIVH